MRKAVQAFGLALSPYRVLTEAASGHFALTPLIAAEAGAARVYALARDSEYGSACEVGEALLVLARAWGLAGRVEVLYSRDDDRLGAADIVTNLGAVRPIDAALLDRLKPLVAVPLMWETWEFRQQDLDLAQCRLRGIPVLGTDERHPDLQIFGYLGPVAMRLLHQLDIEVFRSSVAVIGGGKFAEAVQQALAAAGAAVARIEACDLAGPGARCVLAAADAAVVIEHHDRRLLIGAEGAITAQALQSINPSLAIAHVCGGVRQVDLDGAGLRYAPATLAPAGYMSVSTAHAGPRPVVDLHAAGLRVGQDMAQALGQGLRGLQAEEWALAHCPYAQGFQDRHQAAAAPKAVR